MKRIITVIVVLVVLLTGSKAEAQQDAQYTQYMYNTISINPAYAGTRDVLSVVGLYRTQWVGLEGAPDTGTFSFNSPVGKANKVGIGLSIINDKIGPTQETYVDVDFSYRIKTTEKSKLSFGLKVGGHLLDVNFDQLNQFVPMGVDPLTSQNIDNKFSPNIGAGIYYYSEDGYLGFSIPNFLKTEHFDNESLNSSEGTSYLAEERLNLYLIGGYVFDISDNTKFKPAVLFKAVDGAPLQADLSANFLFSDKFILGAAYRWSAAVSGMVGFQISDSWLLGFAYDRETTELGNTEFDDGSFEVMLRYELFNKVDKIITPRFF